MNAQQRNYNYILFETIERIARFSLHISQNNSDKSFTQKQLIGDYYDCLKTFVSALSQIHRKYLENASDSSEGIRTAISDVYLIYRKLSDFHQHLRHMPRSTAPVELNRFARLLKKYINLKSSVAGSEMLVYLSEHITAEAFYKSPIQEYNEKLLNDKWLSSDFSQDVFESDASHTISLSIPRIDSHNPCSWPTLVHEVAHHVLDTSFTNGMSIDLDFRNYVTSSSCCLTEKLKSFFDLHSEVLQHWLTEVWCDLFSALVMGPAFLLSQYSSFLFGNAYARQDKNYPPPYCRIYLIKNVLNDRFGVFKSRNFDQVCSQANSFGNAISSYAQTPSRIQLDTDDYVCFAMIANAYFKDNHFKKDSMCNIVLSNQELSENMKVIIKYAESIAVDDIRILFGQFGKGFPIPSVRMNEFSAIERETSVQEILLAAQLFRNTTLQNDILEQFTLICTKCFGLIDPLWESFCSKVTDLVKDFDYRLLRSIQVSEYVHLLKPELSPQAQQHSLPSTTDDTSSKSLLSDSEIYSILMGKDLMFIPLIDPDQVGSTSIDIRLGTSFQIYYPNQSGIIDFVSKETVEMAERNSTFVDLDYLEDIVISPGQFILGHTMEYIGLPCDLAAEVEGRSSFARLGIEVHMTAGFVDPGFRGVLTLEIFNAGPNPIKLYPGLRIGQLRLFKCKAPSRSYDKNPNAKYRGLLAHRGSLHSKDSEILAYRAEFAKLKAIGVK